MKNVIFKGIKALAILFVLYILISPDRPADIPKKNR